MRTTALLAGTLLLVACGGNSLEADDPAGYEACQLYAEATQITDDPLTRVGLVLEAGAQARRASTPEIRDATGTVGGESIADGDALAAACEAHGVTVD